MNSPLRVLVIEDSVDDAAMLVHILRHGGYQPASECVDTPAALQAALRRAVWDIVLSDYILPQMNGLDALALVRAHAPDLPFILVSGKVGEEAAVAAMKAGAQDVIMKGNPARLTAAVERELREAEMRRARRQAEMALQASEERYRAIVEDQTELICRALPDGTLTFVNNAYCRYFDLEAGELIGRRAAPQIHPDDQAIVNQKHSQFSPQNPTITYWHRSAGPTREICWQQWTVRAFYDDQGRLLETQSVGQDITERKRAAAALEQLRRRDELILNSAGEGILGLDRSGNHTFVNSAAAGMLQYTVDELIGRHSHAIWHHSRADRSPYPEDECPIYGAFRDGIVHREADEVFWRKDGTCFPVEYVSTPIGEDGRTVGAVLVFTDITERRRVERQLVHAERLAALGRLAAALAHEINNPLQAIQSHLELVLDFPLEPEEHAEHLRVARQEIERLSEITRRVLSFARPAPAPRQRVCVADLVRRTLDLAGKKLQHNRIQVTTDLQPALPVLAAPDQLVQVLLSLTLHSAESMSGDGRIHISVRREADQVVVTITSEGATIPPSDLPHVFEPFYADPPGGAGLDLSISYSLVHQHNGTLTVENAADDRGMVFALRLPAAPPESGPGQEA